MNEYDALTIRRLTLILGLQNQIRENPQGFMTVEQLYQKLIRYFFITKTVIAEQSEDAYKLFGPNEFVDLLLYLERDEIVSFHFNPKRLREKLKDEIKEDTKRFLMEGKFPEQALDYSSESSLYLSQAHYVTMLHDVFQKETFEKLKEEGLIGEKK